MADQQNQEAIELAELFTDSVVGEEQKLNSFIDLAIDLKKKQEELDTMAADTLPAAILTSYSSDIQEPNENGDLIQLIAQSPGEQDLIDSIYRRLSVPIDKVVYSLLKNGIAILRFSKSADKSASSKAANEGIKQSATEDILVEAPGKILPEVELVQDTFTVFPILQKERCVGYLEVRNKDTAFDSFSWQSDFLSFEDVIIHAPQDFTYVKFGVSKSSKPLMLRIKKNDGTIVSYTVDQGCSLLENSYTSWKTLSILLDSVAMAALIKNAKFLLVQAEAGIASKQQIEAAKLQLKNLFEGKLSLGSNGIKQYLSPQAKPNFIYTFTQNGKGAITTQEVGGEFNPGQLYYLTPYINQFFAGMGAPKQNFGFSDGSSGLDGGGSAMEQYNIRYMSNVVQFKRLIAKLVQQAITTVLLSRGLKKLPKNFVTKVHKAYQEVDNTVVQKQQSQLGLFQAVVEFLGVEDEEALLKLKLVFLRQVFTSKDLLDSIQEAVKKPEEIKAPLEEQEESEDFSDLLAEDEPLEVSDEIPEGEPLDPEGEVPVVDDTLPEVADVVSQDEE